MKKTRADLGTRQWKSKRRLVLERDRHTCYICGGEANQVDHIIAKVNGGTEDLDNLAACCSRCNALKGTLIDRPKREVRVEHTSDFQNHVPPTRSSARISPPETKPTEGNPFQ